MNFDDPIQHTMTARIVLMVLLLGCGCSAFSQTAHPYKMDVTASLAGRGLLPVIFHKVDDNTIFTAAVENRQGTSDTIFVALLDSCGSEKVSRRLVSKYTIRETKTFSVHTTQHGYVLAISSHYQRLLFLDKNLNFEHARNITRFKNPVFSSWGTGLMIYDKDSVTNRISSIVLLNEDGQKMWENIGRFETTLNAATRDKNGNIFFVGSYQNDSESRFYLTKTTTRNRIFSKEYAMKEPFVPKEILLQGDEIVVLGIGPNSSFASLYFNQLGELTAEKFYDVRIDDLFESGQMTQGFRSGLALGRLGEHIFYTIGVNRELRFWEVELTVYQNRLLGSGWGLQGVQYDGDKSMKISGVGLGSGLDYCGESKEIKAEVEGSNIIKVGERKYTNIRITEERRASLFKAEQAPMTQTIEWQVHNECPGVLKSYFPFIDTVLCNADSIVLASRIFEGIPVWNVGDTARHITVDTSGIYIAIQHEGLCGTIDYQRVRFIDSVEFGLPEDSSICGIDTFDFNLPPDLAYSWQFPDGSKTSSPKILPKESGPYVLTVHSSSCLVDTIEIGVYEFPEAMASPDDEFCKGDTVTLHGDGGETYLWTPADFLNDDRLKSPKAFPPNTQLYRVVVTSKEGCHDTDFVNLEVHPYAKPGFTLGTLSIPFSAENVRFTNQSTDANQFAWFVNGEKVSEERNFQFVLADTGLYYIKLLSKNDVGCNDSIEQQIRILPISLIHIPNAFSPNGDGINETFAPSTFYFQEYEMTIFSRWGQRIWKSRNGEIFPVWDGTMDQSIETVPVGTYQYIIKGTDKEGEKHEYVGKVHVVR